MIKVHRINGVEFAINPDLIERITSDPDSTVTMVDGVKYVILESVDDIIDLITDYRAKVLAAAYKHDAGILISGGAR